MKNLEIKNVDCHATLGMIEKRWGFPRRTLRALLGMTKSGQSGRSMIEMLGVLAIIGVLSVGGIAGYSKAMHRYKINKAIEQITLIAGNVRSFFAPQRSYEGLGYCWEKDNAPDSYKANCKLIKKAKLMPDEMWDDNDKRFNNVFGYSVQLYTINKSTDSDKQAFRIQYIIGSNGEKGNEERCIDLLTYDWTAANIGFISLYDSDIDLKVPVSVDNAINVCSDENNESISFFFDVDVKWYRTVDHDGYTWYD